MGYIRKEEVAEKRKAIRKAFPAKDGWKFSVVRIHGSVLSVAVMASPKEYEMSGYRQLNHYRVYEDDSLNDKAKAALKKVLEIMLEGYWDESDIMTDYHNCAWYNRLAIGKWDRDAVSN